MQSPVVEPLEDLKIPATNKANPVARLTMFVVLGLCLVVGWQYMGPKSAMAEQGWISDWDRAIERAQSSGKPALVLFTADWCPACHELQANVLTKPELATYLRDNFTLVVVDLTDREGPNAERAREFGVKSIPTLIRYNASKQEVSRANVASENAFMAWLSPDKSSGTASARP